MLPSSSIAYSLPVAACRSRSAQCRLADSDKKEPLTATSAVALCFHWRLHALRTAAIGTVMTREDQGSVTLFENCRECVRIRATRIWVSSSATCSLASVSLIIIKAISLCFLHFMMRQVVCGGEG
jgi:hypothetical protein